MPTITTQQLTETRRNVAEMAKQEYLSKFPSLAEAVEFEEQCLSIGDEHLPPAALEVVQAHADGREFTASSDYWAWLTDEVETSRGL